VFQTFVLEKIRTVIFKFNNFFSKNRAFYEQMWKNMVDPDRQQITT